MNIKKHSVLLFLLFFVTPLWCMTDAEVIVVAPSDQSLHAKNLDDDLGIPFWQQIGRNDTLTLRNSTSGNEEQSTPKYHAQLYTLLAATKLNLASVPQLRSMWGHSVRTLDLSHGGAHICSFDIGLFPQLESLNLSHNDFRHDIPPKLLTHPNIRSLNLFHNRLSLARRHTFSAMPDLVEVDLSYNDLSIVPACLADLGNLKLLDLSGNNLSAYDVVDNDLDRSISGYIKRDYGADFAKFTALRVLKMCNIKRRGRPCSSILGCLGAPYCKWCSNLPYVSYCLELDDFLALPALQILDISGSTFAPPKHPLPASLEEFRANSSATSNKYAPQKDATFIHIPHFCNSSITWFADPTRLTKLLLANHGTKKLYAQFAACTNLQELDLSELPTWLSSSDYASQQSMHLSLKRMYADIYLEDIDFDALTSLAQQGCIIKLWYRIAPGSDLAPRLEQWIASHSKLAPQIERLPMTPSDESLTDHRSS